MNILATIWYYLFPVLLVGSLIIILAGKHLKIEQRVRIVFKVFFTLIGVAYIYYTISLLLDDRNKIGNYFSDFNAINESFYYWSYYIAFFFFLASILIVFIYEKLRNKKR
jgi:hypothetical protein